MASSTYSGRRTSIVSKTGNYTVTATDYTLVGDTSGGGFAFTLPAGTDGQEFVFIKSDAANTLTLTPDGAETISDVSSYALYGYGESITLQFLTDNWFITRHVRFPQAGRRLDKTSNYSVLAYENGCVYTNEGSAGSVQFTLPAAKRGLHYFFICRYDNQPTATHLMTIIRNGSDTINSGTLTGQTTITLDDEAESVEVECYEDTVWDIVNWVGSYTVS